MPKSIPLPDRLGAVFSVAQAREAGVRKGRLRGSDLSRPFLGVRSTADIPPQADAPRRDWVGERERMLDFARAYATRMRDTEFFCHETAALIWGTPLPLSWRPGPLDVGVLGPDVSLPRTAGVRGRRLSPRMTGLALCRGLPVTDPETTWAGLGQWRLPDSVALGDYLCRVWRAGVGRPDAGRPPLATPEGLGEALRAGRRRGAPTLRESLALVRCDSWSPRETECRLSLLRRGLPEPELNVDVFDEHGAFLACVDMAYPAHRVAVEYHGRLHAETYAQDVERIARLRASGWIVIEASAAVLSADHILAGRVREALRRRGRRR